MKGLAYEVIWPRGRRAVESVSFAKRLDTLEGKTIGFLWDWIFRGNEIFPVIEKELVRRYPRIIFIGHEVFGSIHGGEEATNMAALPDRLKKNQVDAIISGIGC